MDNKFLNKYKSIKDLSLAMGIFTSASIFGPLVLIGGAGYLLDRYFGTKPIMTIVAVFIAFIISNILLFKKTMILTRHISEYGREKIKEQENGHSDKNKTDL